MLLEYISKYLIFASGYIEDYCGLSKSQPYSKYFLRASAIARSESIDHIWLLLLLLLLARFVKYSNVEADMASLMLYKVVGYEK